ncbi:YafY family protein [Wukongibacter baidiensis]|uniref:helix-turn-helix transcriptional regulator n=1 Tax=Wukongibacter baidiensis TaxID=1723361 RepID=UPI003D7F9A4B
MRKSERINDMMIYLNDKNFFNLKDIMSKYGISKSTALRDIQSLEMIGMPIYSQPGRNGYYGILQNRLLSPIIFTVDEVYALYFSMLTLNAYETTPFHLNVENLKQKFELCLSKEQINRIHGMEEIFSLGYSQHYNSSPFLKDILQMAIEEKVCKITYNKKDIEKLYYVQFFDISSAYGQWYSTAFNHETKTVQVFRCDKVLSLTLDTKYEAKSVNELKKKSFSIFRKENATDFEIGILPKGVDLFYKEHYPSMQLYFEKEQYFIRGFYNKGEENFIANYLINYTDNIISIKPIALKNIIKEKLSELKEYYEKF